MLFMTVSQSHANEMSMGKALFLRNFVLWSGAVAHWDRLHGHPQMIRFGAHLVLALRHILTDDLKEHFREKLWFVGDLILNT